MSTTALEGLEAGILQSLEAIQAECAAAIEATHMEALNRAEDRVRAAELENLRTLASCKLLLNYN